MTYIWRLFVFRLVLRSMGFDRSLYRLYNHCWKEIIYLIGFGLNMMYLCKRDYCTLTPAEAEEWNSLKQKEIDRKTGRFSIRKSSFLDYPKAVRHYLSLFPNNYLDIMELGDAERLKGLVKGLSQILDSGRTKESDIVNYLKQKKAYFIIGSLLKSYFKFGHHDAFVFPEFQLGNSFKVDYLIVGRSSDGFEFVLVELEAPSGNITTSRGELGAVFRKGLNQIGDWDSWIDSNYTSLKETFDKYKKPDKTLPEEFTRLDKSRINYAVIAGRRKDFTRKTYRIRRKSDALILHYDNLLDSSANIIGKNTY